MRLLHCEVSNFGSYKRLPISFENLGLTLIQGETGSGKSTIPDMAFWIMFGQTAKDGNADEVRNWNQPDEVTTGVLSVETPSGVVRICRARGKGKNDLYWFEGWDSQDAIRGKDLAETQKLLSQRLGVTADLYAASAYISEFSPASSFFLAKAKDRRSLFEKIAPLALPVELGEKAAAAKKATKLEHQALNLQEARDTGAITQLKATLETAEASITSWEGQKHHKINELKVKASTHAQTEAKREMALIQASKAFEFKRAKEVFALQTEIDRLKALHSPSHHAELAAAYDALKAEQKAVRGKKCPTCNQSCGAEEAIQIAETLAEVVKALQESNNIHSEYHRLQGQLEWLPPNPHGEFVPMPNVYVEQIDTLMAETNPQIAIRDKVLADLNKAESKLDTTIEKLSEVNHRLTALESLYDLSYALRGILLKQAVSDVEEATNMYLERFFDSQIRVQFSIEDSDSLEVTILKGGNVAVYKQLSKGQRGLLKLCFGVAIMKAAANHAGVHFQNLFFDEALDGLDTELKIKSFTLFEHLAQEHESIMIIDHDSDFRNLFQNKITVTMEGDYSEVTYD